MRGAVYLRDDAAPHQSPLTGLLGVLPSGFDYGPGQNETEHNRAPSSSGPAYSPHYDLEECRAP